MKSESNKCGSIASSEKRGGVPNRQLQYDKPDEHK